MTRVVDFAPEAIRDLDEAFEYLSTQNSAAARKFSQAVRRTFERLSDMPRMGVARQYKNPALEGVRMFPISGFRSYLGLASSTIQKS